MNKEEKKGLLKSLVVHMVFRGYDIAGFLTENIDEFDFEQIAQTIEDFEAPNKTTTS